jgi:hypothetical protein
MNWNDYEAVWKRQELPVGAGVDLAEVRTTFETKRRKLAATLLVRDLAEAAAGLLFAGVMANVAWHMGPRAWPLAFAIALVLGISGFFVRERLRTRRLRLGADAPLLTKIESDLAELRHQRRLLLNLWSWYLGPCLGALAIFGFTVVRQLPPAFFAALRQHPPALAWIVLYLAVILPACFWGAWAMNRRAVRKSLEPRIAELEKLRQDLVS